jgi:hypothetical protein
VINGLEGSSTANIINAERNTNVICIYKCECMFVQKSLPTSRRGRKLKFDRLIEGPSKPKGKIPNPENFVPRGPKLVMENAMFNLICKSLFGVHEGAKHYSQGRIATTETTNKNNMADPINEKVCILIQKS